MASSVPEYADLPSYFNAEFFQRTLENGLRSVHVHIGNINIENITLGGENYCSDIYRALITYRDTETDCNGEHTISLIIKCMPRHKQGILGRLHIYRKETLFYLDIKPKLETLMWHTTASWQLAAKHFHSITVPEQIIVFENLCEAGFKQRSRQLGLDKAHTLLVMRKLGEYHALTMTMAEKEPEYVVEPFGFGLLNVDSIKGDAFKALFGTQLLKLASLITEYPDFKDIADKLHKYYENFAERVLKSVYPLKGAINVLNHGDLWVNNLFFKYNNDQVVEELRFIDFQLCFYGSPGFDVNYFLNTSVQLEVLTKDRHLLIDTYYNALAKTLEQLPYTKALPTYSDILQEIQQREPYGFFVAFGFFPLMSMVRTDSMDNTLERFHDKTFAQQKIELMFKSNARTMETLKYALSRLDALGILD